MRKATLKATVGAVGTDADLKKPWDDKISTTDILEGGKTDPSCALLTDFRHRKATVTEKRKGKGKC